MGTVYKARDTRLDRTVAIKKSAEAFSDRFEREAQAIAALNHPHICQLYDVGPDYLVMELVDGKPLAGPLPPPRRHSSCNRSSGCWMRHRKGIRIAIRSREYAVARQCETARLRWRKALQLGSVGKLPPDPR
jgi:aminoglycoside phosphotransferase